MVDKIEEQEPSIEDILESIRQIISDDEEESTEDGGDLKTNKESENKSDAVDMNKAEALDADKPADIKGDDIKEEPAEEEVLVLNNVVEDIDGGDLKENPQDDYTPADIEGDTADNIDDTADVVMEEILEDTDGRIMSENTENLATDSFLKLTENAFIEESGHAEMVIAPGRITLEQMTRELMRPMLKDWLDSRLPDLVEGLVQKEIKKLSDRAK